MPENGVAGPDVARIAASSLGLPRRAEQMPTVLRRLVPIGGARPAWADPHHARYATAAAADLADPTLTFLISPQQAPDIDVRTAAAVRAERAGLYVPCVPGPARGEAQ
jgi:hypothetical protein